MVSVVIGLLLGWLVLLETGVIHGWGIGAVLLQVAVVLGCVALSWLWVRYWERLVERKR